MSEGEVDSTQEEVPQINNIAGMDEVQGEWELDDLVTDLQNEWCQHKKKCDAPLKPTVSSNSGANELGNEFFTVTLSSILQPVQPSAAATRVSLDKK